MKPTTLARAAFSCLTWTIALPLALGPAPAVAGDVSLGADQLCGLMNAARPDRDGRVRNELVQGRNGPIDTIRFGRGSPLLLITGYRATLREWDARFLGELARHHEVIVFDNRGVGRTAAAEGRYGSNYRIRDMAADAGDVIAALRLKHVNVIGWSMGGMIAQQLALDAPEKVESLTLIATAPPGPSAAPLRPEVQDVLSSHGPDAFGKIMKVLFPPSAVADATKCFVSDMFAPPGYAPPSVPDAVASQQKQAMADWFEDSAAAAALRHAPVRTLVIAGAQDEVLADVNATQLEQIVPRAGLDRVSNAGHALMFQYPAALAQHIDAFVKQ
ncbi:alpha/beta hydrolase [Trinickia caryophylli]|uniref:Pimeloyl-ACP methyl ester carboxylesterase n=1 Tax=Trinickia caryophylli TaxID=28094 RepID=A0A1X7FU95_TRICW|nr:alpha/beta hydrolase [Trinickia caryophylli]PMS11867.1 alpha/beta hydrolase [Trinickia caryophylli]TRX14058.1 alpha/beta hydrolase [Trinickia caryophylli]WQE13875.1 alpha/beta hydrolase [Trinickia caryophylli]SMF58894.1 Pimeloyl-ACP methyl ester carboxylesterase [Trinickia caryophylli]GLU33575.1 alpha/beta hydrolase [Trinickia caryophylli]